MSPDRAADCCKHRQEDNRVGLCARRHVTEQESNRTAGIPIGMIHAKSTLLAEHDVNLWMVEAL